MSNILSLTKVLIKNNVFGFSGKKKKGKEVSTKGSAIGFFLIILICGCTMGIPVIYLLKNLLQNYNLSELVISFVLPIGAITSIIFGVFSIISVFYFSKDSEQLLPLPIKSSELLISKFLASLVSVYLILIMFIFPIIIGVGIGIHASIVYYLYSTIIFILLPIIPSVIMAIILMLVNKVFNFGKKKDMFMYIMTGLILIFSFGYSFGLEFFMNEEESAILSLASGDFSEYIKFSRYLFPFFNSATYSLVNYDEFIGLASLMTFVGLNILFMGVLYFVGDKLYVKGLINTSGTKNKKKEDINKIYKSDKGGVIASLVKKEWIIIKRSPVFMLNVVISNLIFPIIFGISLIFELASDGEGLSSFAQMFDYSNASFWIIIMGILVLVLTMTNSSSSCISRDGSSARFNKSIPVSFKTQIDAKVYFSMIINFISLVFMEVMLFFLLECPIYYLIIITIPMVLILLINNYLSLIIDLRRPKLDWSEESEAVKQNFNVFISMLVSLALSSIIIIAGVLLFKYNLNIYISFTLISVLLFVAYGVMMFLINKYQNKLFSKVG